MPPSTHPRTFLLCALALGAGFVAPNASAQTPHPQLSAYVAQAGTAPRPAMGERFFTTTHGKEWSCASCHGQRPITPGRHAGTGKAIGALAPSANPNRFTDTAKTEKWFRRNCNDVLGRECTAGEKADVLAWLLGLSS